MPAHKSRVIGSGVRKRSSYQSSVVGYQCSVISKGKEAFGKKGSLQEERQFSVIRSFVALEPVSDVRDNVAGKLRRYTSTTLHEYSVVLPGYVGSVVVPPVLVSTFPIQLINQSTI